MEAINLQVGDLSDLREEWMQHYFDYIARETLAGGADLRVERVPAILSCRDCGNRYTFRQGSGSVCPECSSSSGDLVSGREYTVVSLEAI